MNGSAKPADAAPQSQYYNEDIGTSGAPVGDEYGRVRVWWEPTDDRLRSGFAGAWWPAKVLARHKNKLRVKYDNGEEDDVIIEHVSPLDTLPVPFGGEEGQLLSGEFCEVFNGSKTDPCAWLGRVVKFTKSSNLYLVEYPFHDSKPERIEAKRIRRARIMEDGEWRLIKPRQHWEDGEVTSPNELELIHEDDLYDHVDEAEAPEAAAAAVVGDKRSPADGAVSEASPDEEDSSDGDDDDGETPKKKRRRRSGAGRGQGKASVTRRPALPTSGRTAPSSVAPAAGPSSLPSWESEIPPRGMLSLNVTVEPWAGGAFCFVPVTQETVPPGAIQVYFPYSAVVQLRDSGKVKLPGQSGGGPQFMVPQGTEGVAAGGNAAPAAGPGPAHHQAGASGNVYQQHEEYYRAEEKREPKKRYMTAWNAFVKKRSAAMKAAHPEQSRKEILLTLGSIWQTMKEEDKVEFVAESNRSKAFHEASKQRAREAAVVEDRTYLGTSRRHSEPPIPMNPAAAPAGPSGAPTAAGTGPAGRQAAAGPSGLPPPLSRPTPSMTAVEMYTKEFIKALKANPGLAGAVSDQSAIAAAVSKWAEVDPLVKSKYEERAAADARRYERELVHWSKQMEAVRSAAVQAEAAARTTTATPSAPRPAAANNVQPDGGDSSSSSIDWTNVEDVLNKGLDLNQVQQQFSETGFTHEAYMLLVDAWRKQSPKVDQAVQLYRTHIHGKASPDWETFLVSLVGADKANSLKRQRPEGASAGL